MRHFAKGYETCFNGAISQQTLNSFFKFTAFLLAAHHPFLVTSQVAHYVKSVVGS